MSESSPEPQDCTNPPPETITFGVYEEEVDAEDVTVRPKVRAVWG